MNEIPDNAARRNVLCARVCKPNARGLVLPSAWAYVYMSAEGENPLYVRMKCNINFGLGFALAYGAKRGVVKYGPIKYMIILDTRVLHWDKYNKGWLIYFFYTSIRFECNIFIRRQYYANWTTSLKIFWKPIFKTLDFTSIYAIKTSSRRPSPPHSSSRRHVSVNVACAAIDIPTPRARGQSYIGGRGVQHAHSSHPWLRSLLYIPVFL